MCIHWAQRPTIGKIFNDLSLTLTSTFHKHAKILCKISEQSLVQLILCYCPFYTEISLSHECMVLDISCYEFGDIAYCLFTHDHNKSFGTQEGQWNHYNYINSLQEQEIEHKKKIIENWPQLPASTVIMKCLNNYWKATCYPNSLVCVCYSCAQIDTLFHNVTIGHDIETPTILKN